MKKIVLVADLVGSRNLSNRGAVQKRLDACLSQLSAGKRDGLVSPYTITLGDEFQAVFSSPGRIFRDALAILIALYPVEVRFAWSLGEITTGVNTKQAIGMDGPAFHDSRKTVEALKKAKQLFAVTGLSADVQNLADRSLELVSHLLKKWPRSRLVILKRVGEQADVGAIARELRVTDQAVYKSIEAGAIRTIVPLFEEIVRNIGHELGEP